MVSQSTDRRQVLKTFAAAGAVGLAGCLGGDSDGTDSDLLTTSLADAHHPTAIATISTQIAQTNDIFADNGVEIEEVTSFAGGGNTVRGIVTGGLGAGKTSLPALVQAYLQGSPIYLCGITQARSDITFHAPADSGIESIHDIAGMTVAISNPGASSEAAAINSIVNTDGLSLDDVEILAAGGLGEARTAVEEGAADVTWALSPIGTQLNDSDDWNLVWIAREHAPYVTQNVLAIGGQILDEQSDLAEAIGHSYVAAHDYIKENVEEAARLWGENNGHDEDLAIRGLSYAGDPDESELYPEQAYNIELDENILKTTADTMIEQGLIDEQPPWEDITRQEVLPEDKRVDWI